MENFNEQRRFAPSDIVVDFFADEINQKDVLEEISAFGDDELNVAFKNLFEPAAERKDPYLTGKGRVTAQQISLLDISPDPELQKNILQRSSREDILFFLSKFRLCMVAEYMLLKRNDLEMAQFYFERYTLYPSVQEYLVSKALIDENYRKLLLNYLIFNPLAYNARLILVAAHDDELMKAYVDNYPLGQSVIFAICQGKKEKAQIDYVYRFLRYPLDKFALAMLVRSSKKCANLPQNAWVYDVRDELKLLAGCDDVVFERTLSLEEELYLVRLPQTNLLKAYLKRFCLQPETEMLLVRRNDFQLANLYFESHTVTFDLVKLMVKEDLEQALWAYMKHHRVSSNLFRLLNVASTSRIKQLFKQHQLFDSVF